jgi:hypothetical protein
VSNYRDTHYLLVEGVVGGDVGSSDTIDSLHVSAEVGTMSIVIRVSLCHKQKCVNHFVLLGNGKKTHQNFNAKSHQ